MNPRTTPDDEMVQAEALPQADATSLVDGEQLEAEVKEMYRHVAREEDAELHFEVGRGLARASAIHRRSLDAIPAEALASFAGVGYHLDLAALRPGEAVLDLGSGSGTDVFGAAIQVGESGRAVGVDFTDEQVEKAARLRDREGFSQVEFVGGTHRRAPVRRRELRCRDLQRRYQPLAGQGPSLRRGGARPQPGRTARGRRHRQWPAAEGAHQAKCRALGRLHRGRDPRRNYVETIEAAGLHAGEVRQNDYNFVSERALHACSTYGVESVSLVAVKES